MANTQKIAFTTPVGRLVMGSLYDPRDKDFSGQPLVYKHGPDAGKPRVEYFIGIAITKDPTKNFPMGWAHSEWGKALWTAGHTFMSSAGQLPSFKWKVDDGDVPKRDERTGAPLPIREGCAGCWILKLSGSFAPKLYNGVGAPDPRNPPPLLEKNAINLGDYVQVFADTEGNGAVGAQAGIYVNHRMVCLVGYGQRIIVGPDVGSAGFGGQPLPPGASMTPVGGFQPPPAAPGMPPGAPQGYGAPPMAPPALPGTPPMAPPGYGAPQGYGAPPMAPPALPGTPPAIPAGTVPNPAFLQPPGMPVPGGTQQPAGYPMPPGIAGQPPAGYPTPPGGPVGGVAPGYPAAPGGTPPGGVPSANSAMTYPSSPRPPAARMTAAAGGIPYEAYRAQNWTDELLIAHGKMLPA